LRLDIRNMTKLLVVTFALAAAAWGADRVKTDSGVLEGGVGNDPAIRVFRGVPFAAPPVGDLRWAPPQR
jgi:para-nitrobenzyl esterase